MANKKIKEFRNMTKDELVSKLRTIETDFFKGKMQLSTGQLANPASLWGMRKDVARVKTLLTQMTQKNAGKAKLEAVTGTKSKAKSG